MSRSRTRRPCATGSPTWPVPTVVRGWLDDGDSATFVGRLVDAGWAGVGVPEEQGGQGGGLVELALTAEQFGATAVPGAAWLTTVLALPALHGLPDVAEAALAGDHPAMLHPADALPYRIPRLTHVRGRRGQRPRRARPRRCRRGLLSRRGRRRGRPRHSAWSGVATG